MKSKVEFSTQCFLVSEPLIEIVIEGPKPVLGYLQRKPIRGLLCTAHVDTASTTPGKVTFWGPSFSFNFLSSWRKWKRNLCRSIFCIILITSQQIYVEVRANADGWAAVDSSLMHLWNGNLFRDLLTTRKQCVLFFSGQKESSAEIARVHQEVIQPGALGTSMQTVLTWNISVPVLKMPVPMAADKETIAVINMFCSSVLHQHFGRALNSKGFLSVQQSWRPNAMVSTNAKAFGNKNK